MTGFGNFDYLRDHQVYTIEKSPLYGLRNKRRLYDLLKSDAKTIKKLLKRKNYHISTKRCQKSGKERKIYAPLPQIKAIQKRLQKLLSRIRVPEYLFSGRKGLCYVDNAKYHISAKQVTTIDISDFYNKCSKEFVFQSFRYTFKMSEDVAWLVTDIVTYKNFIPTGSPASQLVAYWAYKGAFDRICEIANKFGSRFSLFVDDMTFSFDKKIPWKLQLQVKKELEYVGHSFNTQKVKRFHHLDYKIITGCVITPNNEIKVKNKQRKDILDSWSKLHPQNGGKMNEKKVKSLLGKIQSAKQIESDLFSEKHAYLSVQVKRLP